MSVFRKIYENLLEQKQVNASRENIFSNFTQSDTYENAIVNRLRWKGLDLELDLPEKYLYYNGLCAGFDDNGKPAIYPAFPNGMLRKDGYYTNYTTITIDGHSQIHNYEDIVLLKNCPTCTPSFNIVEFYCERMVSVLRAIDNMVHRAKGGNLFEVSSEADKGKLISIDSKIDNNESVLVVQGDSFRNKEISRVPLFDDRESDIVSMWSIFEKYKNELYTTFGFNNVGFEKRERLLVDEVTANNDIIMNGFYGSMIDCRKDFCEKMKEKFGFDITCEENKRLTITNKDIMNKSKQETPQPEIQEVK